MLKQSRRALGAVAMFLSALTLQRAATEPWSVASSRDGDLYRISPVGIARVVAPNDPTVPTVDCRWWPKVGSATLCAVAQDGERSYRRLRLAYPAIQVAMWMAVASIFLIALSIPRRRLGQAVPAIAVCALSLFTVVVMRQSPALAFEVLRGTTIAHSALGSWLGWLSALLAAASAVLVAVGSRSNASSSGSVRAAILVPALLPTLSGETEAQRPGTDAGDARLSDPDWLRADAAAFASLPPALRQLLDVRSRIHPVTPDPNVACVALSPTSDGSRRQRLQGRLGDGTNLVVFARLSPSRGLARVEFVRRMASGEQRSFVWDADGDATTAAEWAAGSSNATTYPIPKGSPVPRAVRALGRLVARWRCQSP